ncbi:MAG: Deoxyribose-phosphate aldolase [Desulfotomaculum sp. 46_296]|nr:MAG: Deoxyribose-phosphate aldolase [Desulfotomaculum sp. 46_296]
MAEIIDHTLLKATASEKDILLLCEEAGIYGFGYICVNPCWVKKAAAELSGTKTGICTVIGFPLGATTTPVKLSEAAEAMQNGCSGIDMVINLGALKSGYYRQVEDEIKAVVDAVSACRNGHVKVIIETCYLSSQEKKAACLIARDAGARIIKTSTGFGSAGATVEDVALIKSVIGQVMGIKAAGGIKTLAQAVALVEAGATRLGTSSGRAILQEMDDGQ